MRAVEKNGEVKIRETPRAERIRIAARTTVKHLDEQLVTKTQLMKTYEMTHREVTELVHFMMDEGTLVDKGRGFTWENQYLVVAPQATPLRPVTHMETPTEKAHRLRMERLYERYGRGVCARCNGPMPGKSQRGRVKRGHTLDICDLQMVRFIQES